MSRRLLAAFPSDHIRTHAIDADPTYEDESQAIKTGQTRRFKH